MSSPAKNPPRLPTAFSISETITLNSAVQEEQASLSPQGGDSTFASQIISLVLSRTFWAEFWIQMETSAEAGWVTRRGSGGGTQG